MFTSRAKVGEPLSLACRPLADEPRCGGLERVATGPTHGVTKRILKVKYNEILTIKCNENAGFSGLSAILTPSRENSYDKVQRDNGRQAAKTPPFGGPWGFGLAT